MAQTGEELSFVGPLRDGEKVLWIGQPRPGCWRLTAKGSAIFAFFLFLFATLALMFIAYPQISGDRPIERIARVLMIACYVPAAGVMFYEIVVRPIRLSRRVRKMRYAVTTHRALITWNLGVERLFIEPIEYLPELKISKMWFRNRGTIVLRKSYFNAQNPNERYKNREENAFWEVEDAEGALAALEETRTARRSLEDDHKWVPRSSAPLGRAWGK